MGARSSCSKPRRARPSASACPWSPRTHRRSREVGAEVKMNEGADSLAGSGEAPVQRQGARSTTGRTSALASALTGALLCAACTSPDPAALFSVSAVETHWAVDPSVGDTQYVAPVVRLKLHNKSEQAQTSVQATAV